jgi:hypothetical protein
MVAFTKSTSGRKAKHYVDPRTGKQVYGLGHDAKSGRWRVIGTNKFFRPDDPDKAIQKFRELTGEKPSREWLKRFNLHDNISTPMGQVYNRLAIADYSGEDPWLEL